MKEALRQLIINYGLTVATGLVSALGTYAAINITNLTKKLKKETNDNKQLLVSALEVLNQLIYIIISALQQKSIEELKKELDNSKPKMSTFSNKKSEDVIVEFIRIKVKEQIPGEMRELLEKHLGDVDNYIDKQIRMQLGYDKIA